MPSRTFRAVVGTVCITPVAAVHADEPEPHVEPPMVVTASRLAETVDDALAPVTVLDRDEIDRRQARDATELLQGQPGVNIVRQGGLGAQTSLFLRGANAGHTLVLVDGVPVRSATAGQAALQHIPIEQIERVEVVRGPRSGLYGSDAIGGVVQFFTRRGEGPPQVSGEAGYGRYNTRDARVGLSGAQDGLRYNVSAATLRSDGFDALDGFDPDDDGYTRDSLNVRLGRDLGFGDVDVHFTRAQGNNEFDGTFVDNTDYVQQSAGMTLSADLAPWWGVRFRAGQARDESDNFLGDELMSRFDTRRHYASMQNDFYVGAGSTLTIGADYEHDRVDSTTEFDEASRYNAGTFTQLRTGLGRHDVQVGLRHDDNEAFGNRTTGSLAYGYALTESLRATASYGTAFKTPTFNDLFFPGFSNPDLDPEKSESYELGLHGITAWGRWDLRAFRTDIRDLIVLDELFVPQNLDRARVDGLEAEIATELLGWRATVNVTLLDPHDRDTGNLLARRVRESAALDIERRFGRARVGLNVVAHGHRYNDAANDERLSGFALVNLRGALELDRHWELRGKIDNLLDKEYTTAREMGQDFNNPKQAVFVSIAYRP